MMDIALGDSILVLEYPLAVSITSLAPLNEKNEENLVHLKL